MAGNINTAPTALQRVATRFRALLIAPRDNVNPRLDQVRCTIKLPTGQTADALEVTNWAGSVLAKISALGVLSSVVGTSAGNVATIDGAQTLTNKTLTSPTINTPTIATPTITGAVFSDIKSTTAPVTANATVTYADVTGLSVTVVPGTYKFRCVLPSTVASGTGGIKYCFKLTTTVLTSIESSAKGFTASAVAVQHTTTTTDQTDLFTQAAVVILTEIEGTMVVGTGGTIKVQVAQNTSNASNTVALLGGSMQFDRIA